MNQHLPRLLNIRYPIIQAPMAGVSTPVSYTHLTLPTNSRV